MIRRLIFPALLSIVALTALMVVVSALGLSCYRIETGSMEPGFPVGTVVVDSSLLRPELNQAITFRADGETVTHVLIGYNSDGSLRTRGLANDAPDIWQKPVYGRDIKGRVLFQFLFLAPEFWATGRGVVTIVGLLCVILAVVLRHTVGRNLHVITL